MRDTFTRDAATKIDQLSQTLVTLRADFDTGIAAHTAVVSSRLHSDVSALGESFVSCVMI